ncbi:MAG: IPT/TIG domain-containing protein [Terriglobales bacterium]
MFSRLSLSTLLVALFFLPGCSNTLNPFCGSSRPAPLIASLAPSTVTFAQVQQGIMLTINGSHFVSSSEVIINGKTLGATVVNSNQLNILLTPDVVPGPGSVNVSVVTPSGNSGDLGCSSGGTTSELALTIN